MIQCAMTLETTQVYAVYLLPHGNPGVDCICSKIVTKCTYRINTLVPLFSSNYQNATVGKPQTSITIEKADRESIMAMSWNVTHRKF